MLNGINRKCRMCQHHCKQWEQLVIVVCPDFQRLEERPSPKGIDLSLRDKSQNGPRKQDFYRIG